MNVTLEDALLLLAKLTDNAEDRVPRILSKEIWDTEVASILFNTPVGPVRVGDNQFAKNIGKRREKEFGMLLPTLIRPDLIFEEYVPEEGATRQTKYVFVKAFKDLEIQTHSYYGVITVKKEGMEVIISCHQLRKGQVINKIRKEQILWNRFASDSSPSAKSG